MNQKKIVIISIFISLTLLSIIVLQFFWIFESIEERKEHLYEHALLTQNIFIDKIIGDSNCVNALLIFSKEKNSDSANFQNKIQTYFNNIQHESGFLFSINNLDNKILVTNNVRNDVENSTVLIKKFKLGNQIFLQKLYYSYQDTFVFRPLFVWMIMVGISILLLFLGFYVLIKMLMTQKKLSSIKNDFINNMTHELKTPIATISAAGEMLLKENMIDNKEKTSKYLRIIVAENQRLKRLVERVLQIAIIDKGALKLKKSTIDIHSIILQSVESLQPLLQSKNGNCRVSLQAKNSDLHCDETHIRNILTNLIENAIKYSENPQIIVSTENTESGMKVYVKDNGKGIDKKDQARIFDKFYRVQTGDIHDVKGFGLGLYYVKKILEEHGGFIQVRSEINQGSTFIVFIPSNH